MKRVVRLEELTGARLNPSSLACVPQRWPDGSGYLGYATFPRPYSGLFFVCSPLEITYTTPDGQHFFAGQNDVVFLPSGMLYTMKSRRAAAAAAIDAYIVNFDFYDEAGNELILSPGFSTLTASPDPQRQQLLSRLASACHDVLSGPFYRMSLLYRLLHSVSAPRTAAEDVYAIQRGIDLLRSEWAENHKISRYAQACGVSESYFRALFGRWAGMSPIQYRNSLRVAHARSFLLNSPMTVTEIAAVTGFEDAFYFSRIFRQFTGFSPRQYKIHSQTETEKEP